MYSRRHREMTSLIWGVRSVSFVKAATLPDLRHSSLPSFILFLFLHAASASLSAAPQLFNHIGSNYCRVIEITFPSIDKLFNIKWHCYNAKVLVIKKAMFGFLHGVTFSNLL